MNLETHVNSVKFKGDVLPLVVYPDPRLRILCEPVTKFDSELSSLVLDMTATMQAHGGLGLAAPQIGVHKRIFVVSHFHGKPQHFVGVYCNPIITEASDEMMPCKEGCLSLPGAWGIVQRPISVSGIAQDIFGNLFRFDYEVGDPESVAIFHEYDHLDGITIPDRMGKLERRLFLKKYFRGRK